MHQVQVQMNHSDNYRSFGPSQPPSDDDDYEEIWDPKQIQLCPDINTAVYAVYEWSGKMNINFDHHTHHNPKVINISALKTMRAYFIGVNMTKNGTSSASPSGSNLSMLEKVRAKVKSPKSQSPSTSPKPQKSQRSKPQIGFQTKQKNGLSLYRHQYLRPTIVLHVFERLMTKKVQYGDGGGTFNLVIICESTIDLRAYSRLETLGGDIYIRCKDLIVSCNCVISGGDDGKLMMLVMILR